MKKLSLVLMMFLCAVGSIIAQRSIEGTVVDDGNEPLIGATVVVEGTAVGTVTDFDGKYKIDLPDGATTLVFSYTGYKTSRQEVGTSNVVDMTMTFDAIGLEDVVVTGYAPQRRKDITGSVASVSADDIADVPGVGVQTALRGRAAGVTVIQNSGAPGSGIDVRVRGSTSISASNRPLYVIDGVPVIDRDFAQQGVGNQGANSLADLNPNDIESIEVLKDASSAAIYGSRAANGVVLINTKKGKAGRTRVTLDASYGVQEVLKKVETLDAEGYREYLTEIFGSPDAGAGGLGGTSDWQDEIFRTSNIQDYNLGISGGDEKTRFYASLSFNQNEGIIQRSQFDRYSARLNLDHVASDKLTIGMNLGYTNSTNQRIQNDNNIFGALSTAILLPPTVPIFNEDGSYGSAFGLENPVAAVNEYDNQVQTNRIIGNAFARYELIDGLSLKASIGIDALSLREDIFESSLLQSSARGTAILGTVTNLRWVNEYVLTYQKRFGQSSLTALGGVSFQEDQLEEAFSEVNDFPSNDFTALSAGANITTVSGSFTGDAIQSYFANVNYTFADKYIVTATFRADGSSRFVNDKFGYFPGISGAWRLSSEDFMANGFFDDLKLRVGWGQTGNNDIGNFTSRQLSEAGTNYLDQPGFVTLQLGNPDLKWETTTQTNIGIDFAMLNSRLAGSLDVYIKNTDDLLLNRPIPTTSGFITVPTNVGEVENRGVELSLTSINFVGDFSWSTTFNFAYNDNEVKKLFNGQPIDVGFATRIAEGQPLGSFFGHQTDGIFQNQTEVEAHATQTNGTSPGDFRFADIGGGAGPDGIVGTADDLPADGVINDDDRTFIGSAIPDFTGGLINNFSYKGIELNLFVQYSLGNEIYNNNLAFAEGMNSVFNPTVRAFENAWREEGDGNQFPRVANGDPNNNRRESDRFVEDGSFIRLKTATLSYTLPNSILGDSGLSKVRIYVSGTNLVTITDYSWFDPEVNTFDGSNTALGTDFLTFPQARSVVFGVNLGF
ncbi:MAG: TonB-dependent receptor [Bacteroidota bacterium]